MRLPLAREGVPFVAVCAVLAAATLLWARSGGWGVRSAAPAVLGALALFAAWFFRDPERRVPPGDGLVVSPADGRVTGVESVEGEAFMAGRATRVTIFLSVFDVHVQRAPLGGRVRHRSYRAGRYLPAWRAEAGSLNEQASLGIETEAGPVLVRQIAGLVARRIATYPREGDRVAAGDRIGLIRFGSRVDLLLPAHWEVAARRGDAVRGGATVVARAGEADRGGRGGTKVVAEVGEADRGGRGQRGSDPGGAGGEATGP